MSEARRQAAERIEITLADNEPGLLIFEEAAGLIGVEGGELSRLHPYESELFRLLADNPNYPFKLSDIKRLELFKDPYAPSPIDVMQGLVDNAPMLEGHLLAVVKSKTQYFSFLDCYQDDSKFLENVELQLEDELYRIGDKSRSGRIMKVVTMAIASTATASAIIGYSHHRRANSKD